MSNKRLLNGYVTVYCPSHPRAMCGTGYEGYVYEHILVAESMLGRPLLSDEVVHHLDFDKSNNTHTNLLVLYNSQHSKLHKWLDNGAPGWKSPPAKARKQATCIICNTALLNNQTKYCSKACCLSSPRETKVIRPTKDQLNLDLSSMSYAAVGRKYGVSDNTIRNWVKFYTKHP